MGREKLVDAMAEAICEALRKAKMSRGGYLPTWQELNDPKWGAGRMRADEFREQARAALAVAEPVVREWWKEPPPGTVRIEQTVQGNTVSTRFDTSDLPLDAALAAVSKARDSLTIELDLAVRCPLHAAPRSRTGGAP